MVKKEPTPKKSRSVSPKVMRTKEIKKEYIKKEVTVLIEKIKTPKKVEKVTPKKRKSVLIQPTLIVSSENMKIGFMKTI